MEERTLMVAEQCVEASWKERGRAFVLARLSAGIACEVLDLHVQAHPDIPNRLASS